MVLLPGCWLQCQFLNSCGRTPILVAINNVSETSQPSSIDILKAQQQIAALVKELQRLRDEAAISSATEKAKSLVNKLDIDTELPLLKDGANCRDALTTILPMQNSCRQWTKKLQVSFYCPVVEKLIVELLQRFPANITDFGCLDRRYFSALDGEQHVRRL